MLWYHAARVYHSRKYVIAKFFPQGAEDHLERISSVMSSKVFYILKKEGTRAVVVQNPSDFKEKCSLGFTGKSMWSPKCILLRNPGDRKWLTGESSKEHIV